MALRFGHNRCFALFSFLFFIVAFVASKPFIHLGNTPQHHYDAYLNDPAWSGASSCPSLPTPVEISKNQKWDAVLQELTKTFTQQFNASSKYYAASAALTYRDQIVWSWNAGKDSKTDKTASIDTVFRIGSISKVFAYLLALIAEEKDLLSMDDPIKTTIPNFSMIDPFYSPQSGLQNLITWKQISAHLAGLPREAPCDFLECNFSSSEILERLKKSRLILPRQTIPRYSNLGFSMLGRFVADFLFKQDYETLVQQYFLNTLSMKNTSFDGSARVITPVPPQELINLGWSAPSGQMYSTVRDLSKLVIALNKAFVSPYEYSNLPIPTLGAVRESHNMHYSNSPVDYIMGIKPEKIRETMYPEYLNLDGTGMGTPWEFMKAGIFLVRKKGGSLNGYNSVISMIPELQLGLTILTNGGVDTSGWANLNLQSLVPQLVSILEPLQPWPSAPKNTTKYVGVYSHDTEISVNILGILTISKWFGEPSSIPLAISPSAPNDPSILQVYVPQSSLGCLLQEELALSYQVVEFVMDEISGLAKSFRIPGFAYSATWIRQNKP